jgi:hypothetical protein
MPTYRLYFLDQGGHIGGLVEMACVDDAAAAELARAHNDGRAMELWLRDRKVSAFPGDEARLKARLNRIDPRAERPDP